MIVTKWKIYVRKLVRELGLKNFKHLTIVFDDCWLKLTESSW